MYILKMLSCALGQAGLVLFSFILILHIGRLQRSSPKFFLGKHRAESGGVLC